MVNGLGVLGWGVGGIEAEAAMLGPAVDHADAGRDRRAPHRQLPKARPRTDLVLTATEMLRKRGVVEKSSESSAPAWRPCRWPSAAPSPTWRPSRRHLRHLPDRRGGRWRTSSSRPQRRADQAGRGIRQGAGIVVDPDAAEAEYTDVLTLDLAGIKAVARRPKRPQDRVLLST